MKKTLISRIEITDPSGDDILEFGFGSIPSTYNHLLLVASLRVSNNNAASARESMGIRINGANSTGYRLYGTGSSVSAGSLTGDYWFGEVNSQSSITGGFASLQLLIPNYNSSSTKSLVSECVYENNASEAWQFLANGTTASSDPVTSITIRNYGGEANVPIQQYSSATLYGISSGSDGTTTVS